MASTNGHRPPAVSVALRRSRELDPSPTVVERASAERALTIKIAAGKVVGRRARETADSRDTPLLSINTNQVILPPWEKIRWTDLDSDRNLLETMQPDDLMKFVMSVSPEADRALWDALRYLNAGFEVEVFYPGTDRPYPRAKKRLDEFRATLRKRHGSEDVVHNRLFMGCLIGGGFFAELITDASGTVPLDIATPDPRTVRFRRKTDAVYGQGYELGQIGKGGLFVSLDGVETVRYLPFDPWPGDPYGRPPFTSMLFPALTLLGVLRDARRVLQQAGFPQRDVSIDYDALVEAMPADPNALPTDPPDPVTLKEWVLDAIQEIGEQIDNLPPDGTFIHTSWIEVKMAEGALGENALSGLDGVVKVLERMLTRAAKSNPLLMALVEGVSEGTANRQWEAYTKSISALQHPCEWVLAEKHELALRAMGIVADVRPRFAELRASDEYRQAQTMELLVKNWAFARDQGWAEQDEAAMNTVGHAAVGEPVPTEINLDDGEPSGPNVTADGDEGPERAVRALGDLAYARFAERVGRSVVDHEKEDKE